MAVWMNFQKNPILSTWNELNGLIVISKCSPLNYLSESVPHVWQKLIIDDENWPRRFWRSRWWPVSTWRRDKVQVFIGAVHSPSPITPRSVVTFPPVIAQYGGAWVSSSSSSRTDLLAKTDIMFSPPLMRFPAKSSSTPHNSTSPDRLQKELAL